MPAYSVRFSTLPEYPLASIPQKKRDLVARGVDVIDLANQECIEILAGFIRSNPALWHEDIGEG